MSLRTMWAPKLGIIYLLDNCVCVGVCVWCVLSARGPDCDSTESRVRLAGWLGQTYSFIWVWIQDFVLNDVEIKKNLGNTLFWNNEMFNFKTLYTNLIIPAKCSVYHYIVSSDRAPVPRQATSRSMCGGESLVGVLARLLIVARSPSCYPL